MIKLTLKSKYAIWQEISESSKVKYYFKILFAYHKFYSLLKSFLKVGDDRPDQDEHVLYVQC